jgi:hypothetical protein
MGGLIIFNLAPKRISEKVREGGGGLTRRVTYYFLINLFTSNLEEKKFKPPLISVVFYIIHSLSISAWEHNVSHARR